MMRKLPFFIFVFFAGFSFFILADVQCPPTDTSDPVYSLVSFQYKDETLADGGQTKICDAYKEFVTNFVSAYKNLRKSCSGLPSSTKLSCPALGSYPVVPNTSNLQNIFNLFVVYYDLVLNWSKSYPSTPLPSSADGVCVMARQIEVETAQGFYTAMLSIMNNPNSPYWAIKYPSSVEEQMAKRRAYINQQVRAPMIEKALQDWYSQSQAGKPAQTSGQASGTPAFNCSIEEFNNYTKIMAVFGDDSPKKAAYWQPVANKDYIATEDDIIAAAQGSAFNAWNGVQKTSPSGLTSGQVHSFRQGVAEQAMAGMLVRKVDIFSHPGSLMSDFRVYQGKDSSKTFYAWFIPNPSDPTTTRPFPAWVSQAALASIDRSLNYLDGSHSTKGSLPAEVINAYKSVIVSLMKLYVHFIESESINVRSLLQAGTGVDDDYALWQFSVQALTNNLLSLVNQYLGTTCKLTADEINEFVNLNYFEKMIQLKAAITDSETFLPAEQDFLNKSISEAVAAMNQADHFYQVLKYLNLKGASFILETFASYLVEKQSSYFNLTTQIINKLGICSNSDKSQKREYTLFLQRCYDSIADFCNVLASEKNAKVIYAERVTQNRKYSNDLTEGLKQYDLAVAANSSNDFVEAANYYTLAKEKFQIGAPTMAQFVEQEAVDIMFQVLVPQSISNLQTFIFSNFGVGKDWNTYQAYSNPTGTNITSDIFYEQTTFSNLLQDMNCSLNIAIVNYQAAIHDYQAMGMGVTGDITLPSEISYVDKSGKSHTIPSDVGILSQTVMFLQALVDSNNLVLQADSALQGATDVQIETEFAQFNAAYQNILLPGKNYSEVDSIYDGYVGNSSKLTVFNRYLGGVTGNNDGLYSVIKAVVPQGGTFSAWIAQHFARMCYDYGAKYSSSKPGFSLQCYLPPMKKSVFKYLNSNMQNIFNEKKQVIQSHIAELNTSISSSISDAQNASDWSGQPFSSPANVAWNNALNMVLSGVQFDIKTVQGYEKVVSDYQTALESNMPDGIEQDINCVLVLTRKYFADKKIAPATASFSGVTNKLKSFFSKVKQINTVVVGSNYDSAVANVKQLISAKSLYDQSVQLRDQIISVLEADFDITQEDSTEFVNSWNAIATSDFPANFENPQSLLAPLCKAAGDYYYNKEGAIMDSASKAVPSDPSSYYTNTGYGKAFLYYDKAWNLYLQEKNAIAINGFKNNCRTAQTRGTGDAYRYSVVPGRTQRLICNGIDYGVPIPEKYYVYSYKYNVPNNVVVPSTKSKYVYSSQSKTDKNIVIAAITDSFKAFNQVESVPLDQTFLDKYISDITDAVENEIDVAKTQETSPLFGDNDTLHASVTLEYMVDANGNGSWSIIQQLAPLANIPQQAAYRELPSALVYYYNGSSFYSGVAGQNIVVGGREYTAAPSTKVAKYLAGKVCLTYLTRAVVSWSVLSDKITAINPPEKMKDAVSDTYPYTFDSSRYNIVFSQDMLKVSDMIASDTNGTLVKLQMAKGGLEAEIGVDAKLTDSLNRLGQIIVQYCMDTGDEVSRFLIGNPVVDDPVNNRIVIDSNFSSMFQKMFQQYSLSYAYPKLFGTEELSLWKMLFEHIIEAANNVAWYFMGTPFDFHSSNYTVDMKSPLYRYMDGYSYFGYVAQQYQTMIGIIAKIHNPNNYLSYDQSKDPVITQLNSTFEITMDLANLNQIRAVFMEATQNILQFGANSSLHVGDTVGNIKSFAQVISEEKIFLQSASSGNFGVSTDFSTKESAAYTDFNHLSLWSMMRYMMSNQLASKKLSDIASDLHPNNKQQQTDYIETLTRQAGAEIQALISIPATVYTVDPSPAAPKDGSAAKPNLAVVGTNIESFINGSSFESHLVGVLDSFVQKAKAGNAAEAYAGISVLSNSMTSVVRTMYFAKMEYDKAYLVKAKTDKTFDSIINLYLSNLWNLFLSRYRGAAQAMQTSAAQEMG